MWITSFLECRETVDEQIVYCKAANTAKIPLGNVGLTKSQVDALFAKGYRIIAGLDILRLKAAAVETRSWTKSNMAT